MIDWSITPADVRGRATTDELSLTDPRKALEVARSIRHPWYRCQALSKVAEVWGTQSQKIELLEEALAAAAEQSEINRIVSVSAWPMQVMVGVAPDAVAGHLRRLVPLADQEPHTVRRADALSMLAFAVRQDSTLFAEVIPSLVTALLTGRGWRIDRLIRHAVEMLNGSMPDVAKKLIEHHSDGQKKRAFLKSLNRIRL